MSEGRPPWTRLENENGVEVRQNILDAAKLIQTIDRLRLRIEDRFPESGLLEVGRSLHDIAVETDLMVDWVARPNYAWRAATYGLVLLMITALVLGLSQVELDAKIGLTEVVTIAEAATNELILIGAAIAFLITFETRQKRKRIIAVVGQLRSVAHVIDAHQLTKDPGAGSSPTTHSPKRTLSPEQISRYLSYCSEMLSLTNKVAFLYVQKFPDPATERVVHDLETLTLGMIGKIWQKIEVLEATRRS